NACCVMRDIFACLLRITFYVLRFTFYILRFTFYVFGLLDLAPGALGLSCIGGGHGGGVIARALVGAGERGDRPRRRQHRAGRGLVLARSLGWCARPLMRLAGQQEPDVAAPDAVDRALAVQARERGTQPLGLSEGVAQPSEQIAQVGGQVVPAPERLAFLVAAGGTP